MSRTAARVVLLDDADRVLLLSGTDPLVGSRWWITPGGGVEAGESLAAAAVRELGEETGFRLAGDDLVGPIWSRVARFTFTGIDYEQTEFYFTARTTVVAPSMSPRLRVHSQGEAGSTMVAALPTVADQDAIAAQRVDAPLDVSGHTELERRTLTGHRWWSAEALADSDEMIYPAELSDRLGEVLAALESGIAPDPVPDVT